MMCEKLIGYVYDGELYCRTCHESAYAEHDIEVWGREFISDLLAYNGRPIFEGEEFDSRNGWLPSCECCGEVLNVIVVEYEEGV